MNCNIFAKANQIIKECDTAYLGVIDENGYPSVSTISVIKPENLFETYFSTGIDGGKMKRLSKDNRASICFKTDKGNVTLVGRTKIFTDQETKSRYWLDWFKDIYVGGETDPAYIIIKFTTERVSLWIDDGGALFTIEELLTVQSRCGLLCKWCTYKEPCKCKGCLEMNGKPFWGECDVANCCINKGFNHCGECDVFPCEEIKNMSYGNDEHNDKPEGARLEVCRAWAMKR